MDLFWIGFFTPDCFRFAEASAGSRLEEDRILLRFYLEPD
jgi:hypothetical protein